MCYEVPDPTCLTWALTSGDSGSWEDASPLAPWGPV